MKLVNRVSAFFLAALAAVLCLNSLVLNFTWTQSMETEYDDRLLGALQILAASIEIEPEDVTWYPQEYSLDFSGRALQDARWVIADEHGTTVDVSPKLRAGIARDDYLLAYGRAAHPKHEGILATNGWRIVQTYLAAPTPQPVETREFNEYASLLVTVAMPEEELQGRITSLRRLLIISPPIVWLVAALGGRTYVRRALRPLETMAHSAREITGPTFAARLPAPQAADELAELAHSFNDLLDRLQHAYDQQRLFASHAAHQLRTPLTVLQGELDVVLRRTRSADEYRTCLERLSLVSTEMRQIMHSLLLLTRSGHQLPADELEPLRLDEWLSAYLKRWTTHARASDLQLDTCDEVWVEAHRQFLTQVLDNLVHNGLLYSRPSGRVTLSVHAVGESVVELHVADAGPQVPPEERAGIFQPFVRGSAARQRSLEGTGLGLPVAKQLAFAMGASLSYRPTAPPLEGNVFVVSFARRDPPADGM